MDNILNTILSNLTTFSNRNAFFINEQFYTYADLSKKVAGISEQLSKIPEQSNVGLITTDSLDTYASIIALWFNNLVFVPLSPANAKERNQNNIEQANITIVLSPIADASEIIYTNTVKIIETVSLVSNSDAVNKNTTPENLLYILFTSGSTGTPKGVTISLKNLDAFVNAFYSIGYPITEQDRFLQIFDFTFDVSVQSYILPLVKGASIYTVPQTEIKFMGALKILKTHKITFAKLVPSTLNYFKPYFNRIDLPHLKYSLFSGEALPYNIAKEWQKCVPNASIENHYGPTEGTIDCLYYKMYTSAKESYQGTMSIGKPFKNIDAQIINENNDFVTSEEQGELIISGNQVTNGYIKNSIKNKEVFININGITYYKTGDIVFKNAEGNYFYCGRKDNQIQVQGYRVELGEIEFQLKKLIPHKNIVITSYSESAALFLILFIEGEKDFDLEGFETNLKKMLPQYMLPKRIKFVQSFPLSTSGKIDKNQLKELIP